jgi:hypothetical protein
MAYVCDPVSSPKRLASMTRPAALSVIASLLFGGCASTTCATGRTGGWFSGWGTGGANAFTVGLHRTWGECADRTPGASQRPANLAPAPSAEPASELQVPPSGAPR